MDHVPVALIEWLDAHGQVLRSTPVYRWPCRIGRAVEVDVHLDDASTAAVHAELSHDGEGLRLTVGDTLNGVLMGRRLLRAGESARVAGQEVWRLGHTRMRLRLPSDPLAPELPLGRGALASGEHALRSPVGWTAWLPWAVLALLWSLWDMWVASEPDTPLRTYLSGTLATAGLVGAWSLLWSLGSQLFQGRLQFHAHLQQALWHGLAWTAVTTVLPMLSFMTGWMWPERVAGWVGAAVLARLVWAHLAVVQPGLRWTMAAGVSAAYATGLALMMWLNVQNTGQVWSQPYAATMMPPAWRLAPLSDPARLLDDAQAFKAALDERARQDEAEAGDEALWMQDDEPEPDHEP